MGLSGAAVCKYAGCQRRVGIAVASILALVNFFVPQIVIAAPAAAVRQYIVFSDTSSSSSSTSSYSFRSGRSAGHKSVKSALSTLGIRSEKSLPIVSGEVVSLTDAEVNAVALDLAKQNLRIEPDYEVKALLSPNDTYYSSYQADMAAINAPQAWNSTTGSSQVVVGVVDTGIDYNHPDLAGNMWVNPGEIPGNNIDDDGDGFKDNIYGANFVNYTGDPLDDHYHGTHVAGTIGAIGNNGVGVTGVNWNVKLMALKVLGSNGSGSTSGIIAAVQYAIAMKQRGVNIRVLNASLGGGGYSQTFQNAITQAFNAGILFVAAAGNSASNNDTTATYPANYTNVVSVAAVSNNGVLASFSNYGASLVQVAAPGVSILNTIPLSYASGGSAAYGFLSGTSMASPHVAGVAALILAANPNFTSAQLRTRLLSSVTPVAGLSGKVSSGGIINAQSAVASTVTYSLSGTVTINGQPLAGAVISDSALGNVTSNNQGVFSFNNLIAGTNYSITISKPGYTFAPQTASGTINSDTTADFVATAISYSIGGVVHVDGQALAGVTIDGGALGSRVTDSSGAYSFANLGYGTNYSLTAAKDGYVFSPSSASGTINSDKTANFVAAVAGSVYTVSGVVTIDGQPLSGVLITSSELGSTTTDESGNYQFSNVAFGTVFSLQPSKAGYKFSANLVTGLVTQDVERNLVAAVALASDVYTVSGRVIANNKPLKGVRITGSLGSLSTNSAGRFVFRRVPVGTSFELNFSKKGYRFSTDRISEVVDSNVTLRVQAYATGRTNSRSKNRAKKKK